MNRPLRADVRSNSELDPLAVPATERVEAGIPGSARSEFREEDEPVFGDSDFQRLRQLVERFTGIEVGPHKRELLYNRLSRRLRICRIPTFAEYCARLEADPAEQEAFVNAVTTNLTSFFRESHHFDFLREEVLAEFQRARERQRIRLWSAGCSTGEEAYSIAMSVARAMPDWEWHDVKVLATDIDSSVLVKARQGRYDAPNLSNDMMRGSENALGQFEVDPRIAAMVAFRQLNLMEAWPMRGQFDAIFCRNVIIYFSKRRQHELMERFRNVLTPSGYLMLGHSESMIPLAHGFRLIGRSIYRRAS